MRMIILGAAAVLTLGTLGGCDRSPQSADGATAAGDPGVSTTTPTGAPADTGRDNAAAGTDIGGAGQLAEPGGATSAGGATSPKSDQP